jgi:hypothetical protein
LSGRNGGAVTEHHAPSHQRIHARNFFTVLKVAHTPAARAVGQYAAALPEMRKRFGSDAVLGKALPTWRDARTKPG